jgi:transcriptional regulator with XRE-family HTH domain
MQISQRALSLKAGFSQSYVGQIIRGETDGDLSLSKIEKLATAAGVDPKWLATGAGTPPQASAMSQERRGDPTLTAESLPGWDAEEERYPTRAAVVAMLRRRSAPLTEIEEMAIEGLLSLRLASPEDPGERHWLTRYRDLQLLAQELVDEDAGRVVRDDSYERRMLDPSRDGEEIEDE